MTGRIAILVLVVAAAAGCSSDTATPLAPTTPPATTFTFASTFQANGSATRSFEQISRGAVNLTLTAASPDVALSIGIGIPRADGTSCVLTQAATVRVASSPQITLTAEPGVWCVRVADVGTVPERVTFSLLVNHN